MPDVRIDLPVATTLLDLLASADQRRAFGGCDDNLDDQNSCRVCSTLEALRAALQEVPSPCTCCGAAAKGGGRCGVCAGNRCPKCAEGPLAPGAAGERVWGNEHYALIHRADHNGPGVTRFGGVILTVISVPETYHSPDPEPWWEPHDRIPLGPAVYLSWPDYLDDRGRPGVSEKYVSVQAAKARIEELGLR